MNHSTLPTLIRSLQNPELYPHPIVRFSLIETHISWVLLTGSYAYKIKKPLNLGFLDFSTLEKRRHFCQEELRLNGRLAPDIYLEVVAIGGGEERPQLNSEGPAIEYAVKMRQFEPDQTFDRLLQRQQLTTDVIIKTAQIIASFHEHITKAPKKSEFGSPTAVMRPVRENFAQIRQQSAITMTAELEQLADWSEREYARNLELFDQRKHNGFIRECHGDLHLGNIAFIDGRIVPFDGIEFNPSLYWIDVISEVAFLVMDLTDKQRPDLAYRFLNEYLQHGGDYAGLKLLPFYLTYRAMVRAKVSAIRASQVSTTEPRQKAVSDYRDYLQLARHYTETKKPLMLIMHGVSGSGKSWLSNRIIDHFPVIRIRSDVERKRLFGLTAQQTSQATIDGGIYSAQASALTYHRLLELAAETLSAGYNVIVDATFLQKQQRKPFFQLAQQAAVPFRIVHTIADRQTLLRQIEERAKLQDNVSDADPRVLQHQLQTRQPLDVDEQRHAIEIDTAQNAHLTKLWNILDEYKH
ncbi:AAA family ATPase [Methylomarinum sp. Ch1-1]|uniref:AAA family ATPase n=1 Tax=Methylomarinum roseum TaxID=3067653 RepID=A0AAU7NTY7_9GAMM